MSQLAGLAATPMPESYLRVDEEPDVVALDKVIKLNIWNGVNDGRTPCISRAVQIKSGAVLIYRNIIFFLHI